MLELCEGAARRRHRCFAVSPPAPRQAACQKEGWWLGSLANIGLGAAPVLVFLRSVQDSYPRNYPRRPSHGASTGPKPIVLRCSRSQSGDIAGAAKLTIFATRDLTRRVEPGSIHDHVNGLRIVTCRSMTWPSCMSSEWSVLQFASMAAETIRES